MLELALVHRIASLLWRLRRASAIETGLFEFQGEFLLDRRQAFRAPRVGSYEARLWRQAAQTIWTLDAMRRPPPALPRRPFRKPVARYYWDAEK
jgi:hypothetical protein